MDCHPDRSFPLPQGTGSGVEGPDVSLMGYTNPGAALEQIAFQRRRIFAISKKILRHGDSLG
jgi:hypothetical protein